LNECPGPNEQSGRKSILLLSVYDELDSFGYYIYPPALLLLLLLPSYNHTGSSSSPSAAADAHEEEEEESQPRELRLFVIRYL